MTDAATPVRAGKPWYRKWRYIIPIAVIVLIVLAVASSPDGRRGLAEGAADQLGEESQPASAAPSTASDPTSLPSTAAEASVAPSTAPSAPPSTAPSEAAGEEGDQGIVFGDPVIFEEAGLTTAGVMVENVSDQVRTFTVQATFRAGESIAATAIGSVNDLAPGERRAVTLLVDETPIPEYDNVRVQVDTMLDQGSSTESSEIASQLAFGEPRVTTDFGLTTVTVELTNNSDAAITLTVGSTFLTGDTLIGVGTGAVNDLAPGETQTAQLLVTGSTENASETLIYADTILTAGE